MNVASFLEHWSINENPFRAEEARHDPVFARLGSGPMTHPDFEKIVGDLSRPSTSIVFGEKGSGKTAIRIQLAGRIAQHNTQHPNHQVLLIAYDDLNPMLDRYCERMLAERRAEDMKVQKALGKLRLVDHMDAILHAAVPVLVSIVIGENRAHRDTWRRLRRAPRAVKRDLQVLQALYGQVEHAERRAAALRWRSGAPINWNRVLWGAPASLGWIVPLALGVATFLVPPDDVAPLILLTAFWVTLVVWALAALKWFALDRWLLGRLARRIEREMRAVPRSMPTLVRLLKRLPPEDRMPESLPVTNSDDVRYAMFDRLKRASEALGFSGVLVVLDRIDEPTMISGDPDRMRAVIWPLMNNKFLQQEGIGFKLLLPIELRHELFRESNAFFQEARLDKQNMVERLMWTGATLYDLCNARLNACRDANSEPIVLRDLFDDDVSRQDVVDALDQMHQPRDAFKLLYQCIQEHCSNVTQEQEQWMIPKLILETVRKQQSDRVQMFYRGMRPA